METAQIGREEVVSTLRKVGDMCPRHMPLHANLSKEHFDWGVKYD